MTILDKLPMIITIIFFLTLLSYYMLLFLPKKKEKIKDMFKSISVIIPAHNEEEFIGDCIRSVINAKFNGKKQIIVIDDGSKDKTSKIVSKFKDVKLIRTKHSGKSASINKALSITDGDLIAIVDGDSVIEKDSLIEITKELGKENTAGACCIIKVKNRRKFLCIWPHIEQLYNSLIRSILGKVNANVTTPGPLSVYRRKELMEIGGFSTDGFSEDVDITIRLIRKGYKIGFSETAIASTNMPYDIKGFLRQRTRFARGMLNIFKRHLKVNKTMIDLYTLPLLVFAYVQAVIMGSFTLYQIVSGYYTYFFSKGMIFDLSVLRFFFEWFSIVGFIKWTISVFMGSTPLTFIALIGIMSTFLSYPLFFHAIIKYDKKFDIFHLIPIFFMAPFWWFIMIIYIICLPEMLINKQYNIWKKNE